MRHPIHRPANPPVLLRVPCPDCGRPRLVERRLVGSHLWDLCKGCAREEDERALAELRRRVGCERRLSLP